MLENLDQLAGEGDLGNEEDGGLAAGEGVGGEFEINIGLAAAGNATEEARIAWSSEELPESGGLGGVERNIGARGF